MLPDYHNVLKGFEKEANNLINRLPLAIAPSACKIYDSFLIISYNEISKAKQVVEISEQAISQIDELAANESSRRLLESAFKLFESSAQLKLCRLVAVWTDCYAKISKYNLDYAPTLN